MEDDTPKIDILLRRVPAVKACCVIIDVETGTAIVSYAGLMNSKIPNKSAVRSVKQKFENRWVRASCHSDSFLSMNSSWLEGSSTFPDIDSTCTSPDNYVTPASSSHARRGRPKRNSEKAAKEHKWISAIIWFIVDLIYLSIYIDVFPFDQKLKPVVKHMTGILIFDTLLELAYCGAFAYLIIGYNKEKPWYIRRWLLIIAVLNLGKLCSTIFFIVFGSHLIFIISLGYTGFHIYYFIVVNTYYQDMDDGGRHY